MSLKFFFLISQQAVCHHYNFQLFCDYGVQNVNFYPGNDFKFENGKYYQIKLKEDMSSVASSSYWQQNGHLTGTFPEGTSYWGAEPQ